MDGHPYLQFPSFTAILQANNGHHCLSLAYCRCHIALIYNDKSGLESGGPGPEPATPLPLLLPTVPPAPVPLRVSVPARPGAAGSDHLPALALRAREAAAGVQQKNHEGAV